MIILYNLRNYTLFLFNFKSEEKISLPGAEHLAWDELALLILKNYRISSALLQN